MDWQAVTVIEPPTLEPVSLEHVKKHCQVDITEDDDYISGLITAARELVELWNNRALVSQTLEAAIDSFPTCRSLKLPRAPLITVDSLVFTNSDGDETEIDPDTYVVDTRTQPGRLILQTDEDWPDDELQPGASVVVQYVAGFATPIYQVDTDDNAIQIIGGRTFADGDRVFAWNNYGSLPLGLDEGVRYYVVNSTGSEFQLSDTDGGTPVNLLGGGVGNSFLGSLIPMKFLHAIMLLVQHWYENREAVQEARRTVLLELPLGVRNLVLTDRIWSF